MADPVYIFSHGLWRLRREVSAMTGQVAKRAFLKVGPTGVVAGWGHKPTADRARNAASRRSLPYIAFEDGFLRSVHPGMATAPSSMVMDRTGIYYDARQPSDLETLFQSAEFSATELETAGNLVAQIRACRLSKYNNGVDSLEGLPVPRNRKIVLVVDQTYGDQSVIGGLADDKSFAHMLEAAVSENPGAAIVAKLHPEVLAGTKQGYLRPLVSGETILLTDNLCPWTLFDLKPKVYTVSSQLGFEALLAGCEVVCFGAPFYAGWGLTDDRLKIPRRTRKLSHLGLAAAVYLRYSHYFDAWRRHPVSPAEAISQLDFLRRSFIRNTEPVIGYRIARWKRKAVTAMLDGPAGPPHFVGNRDRALAEARKRKAAIAAWGVTAKELRQLPEAANISVIAVEDGFVRSAGLGAAFVQPLSLVFDRQGLHYDAGHSSDLEHLLATAKFTDSELARARDFRLRLVAEKVTKYNLADAPELKDLPKDRDIVLVPGQVADDWAVILGSASPAAERVNVNGQLLTEARRRNSKAFVIFKPHPDVEKLGRRGGLSREQERRDADRVIRSASMEPLLAAVTRVETYTSLAGFEALLRGVPVTTHGLPFYAGWGLTEDLQSSPRRRRKPSLDELAAATLLLYPRYWDSVSGLPCPAEVALDRLAELRRLRPTWKTTAAALAGRAVIAWRKFANRQ